MLRHWIRTGGINSEISSDAAALESEPDSLASEASSFAAAPESELRRLLRRNPQMLRHLIQNGDIDL